MKRIVIITHSDAYKNISNSLFLDHNNKHFKLELLFMKSYVSLVFYMSSVIASQAAITNSLLLCVRLTSSQPPNRVRVPVRFLFSGYLGLFPQE
jgi:hypothetical protein